MVVSKEWDWGWVRIEQGIIACHHKTFRLFDLCKILHKILYFDKNLDPLFSKLGYLGQWNNVEVILKF